MHKGCVALGVWAFSFALLGGLALAGPQPVKVGAGSYAEFPPPEAGPNAAKFEARAINCEGVGSRPIPSNHWWSFLNIEPFNANLWAYPITVRAQADGADFWFTTVWAGQDMQLYDPVHLEMPGVRANTAIARDWSDWHVQVRVMQDQRGADITLAHGMPLMWAEFSGNINPRLKCDAQSLLFDGAGARIMTQKMTDSAALSYKGRWYGIYLPAGASVNFVNGAVEIQFGAGKRYLVLAALPKREELRTFGQYAYAIPRKTQVDWAYSPEKSEIKTTWHITTESLNGRASTQVLQGFLPHTYKRTLSGPKFEAYDYATPRGKMRVAAGNDFEFTYQFNGMVPHLPMLPNATPNRQRLSLMLKDYADHHKNYGADTYWGAKDFLNYAKNALIADTLNDPTRDGFLKQAKESLADWLTYTPGEQEHYFARYPRWRALVGFKPSYGSEEFTDNHFHYGYFTFSGAMVGMLDPQFLADYGPMLKLVAKQYANWDRSDQNFPFMRTFDPWLGHSFAGGTASPNGNNQESTSEATQSWAGVFLLGCLLRDDAMRDAGAFGFMSESRAALEYWFDRDHQNIPPIFKHPIVGVVWSGGMMYGTFFSGAPHHIYGIQWLPISPTLNYLAEDPKAAANDYATLMRESGNKDLATFGNDWGNIILAYAGMYDPDFAIKTLDQYFATNTGLAKAPSECLLTYYYAYANQALGKLARDVLASMPISSAYRNADGAINCIVFNPADTQQTCHVSVGGREIGSFFVPPHSWAHKQLPGAQ